MSLPNNWRASGQPLLCYVTDRRNLDGANSADSIEALTRKIAEATAAGVDWVQIREKDLTARKLAALTQKALRSTAKSSSDATRPARILINDRLDVAIAEGAGGVHLRELSFPVLEAKQLVKLASPRSFVSGDFLLGVSCHSLEAARAAERSGADYIFFGPVFATPSKAAFGEPKGLGRLSEVCRVVATPVLAIGGITLESAASCIEAGAAGLAAIRLFQETPDLPSVVSKLTD